MLEHTGGFKLRRLGSVPAFCIYRTRLICALHPREPLCTTLGPSPSHKLSTGTFVAAAAAAVASRRSASTRLPAMAANCVAVAEEAAHGKQLPAHYSSRVPKGDTEVLSFMLAFLDKENLRDVPVYINGGYVRDLLLGKTPDDLDLTLNLRDCPADVTVSNLLEKMPQFALSRPDLGISEVKIATILSNESKDKQLDTFKAHFVDANGVKTEVDVMPTIGEEVYGDENRIPVRDQRGLPEQDALRRDLTIGALLLRVLPGTSASSPLQYELLDFYGGVQDIRKGLLRSPCPHGQTAAKVADLVLRTPADRELASRFGLLECQSDDQEAFAVQTLWWAKVLMDDPLRICRALRFAAKFHFQLHESFWSAVPFALEPLRVKVAGGRKNTEYQKIGSYGHGACQDFFLLAFVQTFGPPGGSVLRLASALFGGQDEKSRPKPLPDVISFDQEIFRVLAATLRVPEGDSQLPASELTGGLLAAALVAAELEGGVGPLEAFNYVCDGMCVSNAMREAGIAPLQAATALASLSGKVPVTNRLDCSVAAATGITVDELALHVQVWEALQVVVPRTGPMLAAPQRRLFALALFPRFASKMSQTSSQVERLAACAERLAFQRPPVRGFILKALHIPKTLSRQVMLLFEVVLRLLRYAEPVEDQAGLEQLLQVHSKLQIAFSTSVWTQEDGQSLREEFLEALPKKTARTSK